MKRFRFWVLCCLGILLTALPVQAFQPLLSKVNAEVNAEVSAEVSAEVNAPAILQYLDEGQWVQASASDELAPRLAENIPELGPTNLRPFDQVIQNTETQSGLFTLYRNAETGKTYLEVKPEQLNQNFLCVSTLTSGIGDVGLYSGMPLRDFVFQLRRVQNNIQLVVPNFYFRSDPGDPQQRSINRSFSDSVLYSLRIQSIHPERQSLLLDLDDLFLNGRDLAGLSSEFPWILGVGYTLNPDLSYLSAVKALPLNVEIDSVYGFSGGADLTRAPSSLADPRGFNLSVRYSLSQLPANTGYRPRLADDRVGYFITAYQNLSSSTSQTFVRHLQRWHLEKQNPDQATSPPKEPIVFWIENTVPVPYRDAIRAGVLMWNDAFEQAGFQDAIQVKQMPDDADWDPADVRYNTIRWFNSFPQSGFAMGPSRVNPLTGQILDADILIDANVVRFLQEDAGLLIQQTGMGASVPPAAISAQFCDSRWEQFYQQWVAVQNGGSPRSRPAQLASSALPRSSQHDACLGAQSAQQTAFGALMLSTMQNILPSSVDKQDYIHQYLRYLTAHEVGHTLGLRHNFRGSNMLAPEDLHNLEMTRTQSLVGSVMDYLPVNLAPEGVPQGDYFPMIVGPYDRWAIEYGYQPIDAASPQAELRTLQQIAARSAEPGLAYATDEDAFNLLDPQAKRWDLSDDSLQYAQWQMDNARTIWGRLEQRYPLPGESYSELRDRFDTVFFYYAEQAFNATRYIGGQTFNRDRRGNTAGRLPFEPVPVEQQRQALTLLDQYLFATDALTFSPTLINQLAPSRWYHWGSLPTFFRLDYPIYDNVLTLQSLVLSDLLSSDRLARIRDAELRTPTNETLALPELFEALQQSIWTEVLNSSTQSAETSTLRRGLQRQHLDILVNMTLRNTQSIANATNFIDFVIALQTLDTPEDARVLARYQLRQLQGAIASTLRRQGRNLDISTQAHLEDVQDRITKALNAQLQAA